jgi:hypothetical protein
LGCRAIGWINIRKIFIIYQKFNNLYKVILIKPGTKDAYFSQCYIPNNSVVRAEVAKRCLIRIFIYQTKDKPSHHYHDVPSLLTRICFWIRYHTCFQNVRTSYTTKHIGGRRVSSYSSCETTSASRIRCLAAGFTFFVFLLCLCANLYDM